VSESSFFKRPTPLVGLETALTVLGIVQDYLRRRSARFNLGAHLLDLLCLLFELRSDRCFKFAAARSGAGPTPCVFDKNPMQAIRIRM
jgi:hypothetical protein